MQHIITAMHSLSHLSEMLVGCEHLLHHTAPDGLYGVNCTACVAPLRGGYTFRTALVLRTSAISPNLERNGQNSPQIGSPHP